MNALNKFAAVALMAVAGVSHAASDPFANGSFEDSYNNFATHWYDASNPSTGTDRYMTTGGVGNSAYMNMVAGSGSDNEARLKQVFDGLSQNTSYNVSFSYMGTGLARVSGNGEGNPSYFSLSTVSGTDTSGDDIVYAVSSSAETWQQATFSFNTGTTNPTYSLWFKTSSAFKLDNVSIAAAGAGVVSAVPETQSYAMMLAGLGALGLMSRRRRQ